jgi:hypothetical protein
MDARIEPHGNERGKRSNDHRDRAVRLFPKLSVQGPASLLQNAIDLSFHELTIWERDVGISSILRSVKVLITLVFHPPLAFRHDSRTKAHGNACQRRESTA